MTVDAGAFPLTRNVECVSFVLSVGLYSLDFLRKCRELSDWYGNGFYFAANPLMVAFPISRAKEVFKMEPLLHDQLHSLPHDRRGIVRVEDKRDWKHQQFLNDFRRRFFDASKDRYVVMTVHCLRSDHFP